MELEAFAGKTFVLTGTLSTMTRDEAKELLSCFWIKVNNQPAPPKVGVTAQESSTYTDFANINLGGLTPDGADADAGGAARLRIASNRAMVLALAGSPQAA